MVRVPGTPENRFTGWTDVDLSEKGEAEARSAGQLSGRGDRAAHRQSPHFGTDRAVRTAKHRPRRVRLSFLPVRRNWRLNERHYGALQGGNKKEAAEKFGPDQVKVWRRSYATPPPRLSSLTPPSGARSPLPRTSRRSRCLRLSAWPTSWSGWCPTGRMSSGRSSWRDHTVRGRARQQHSCADQVPRAHLRRRHRRPRHPDRVAQDHHARRQAQLRRGPLPRRPRGSRGGSGGGSGASRAR